MSLIFVFPQRSAEANAIGAAMAQVGGLVDKIFSYKNINRENALQMAKEEAIQKTIAAGGDAEKVEVVDMEEIPLAYSGGESVRVRVKAVSDLCQLREHDLTTVNTEEV